MKRTVTSIGAALLALSLLTGPCWPAGTHSDQSDQAEQSRRTKSKGKKATSPARYMPNYMAEGYRPHPTIQRDKHGRIKRSSRAKNTFKRQRPCPKTGKRTGPCPGYVIDHVKPLECGGADAPSNMQWQTTADARAKDKTERYCR